MLPLMGLAFSFFSKYLPYLHCYTEVLHITLSSGPFPCHCMSGVVLCIS